MSVTLPEALAHLAIPAEDLTHDTSLELFVAAANAWMTSSVTDTAPDDVVKLATLELIRHWWNTQRGPASAVSPGDEYGDDVEPGLGIPRRILGMVGQWLTSGAASSASGTPTGCFPDALAWPDPVEFIA